MNEDQIQAQAAINELKAHNDFLVGRCVNMAAENAVLVTKIAALGKETHNTKEQKNGDPV